MGFVPFEDGHARVRLDDDRLIRHLRHGLRRVEQFVRADGAVRADHVRAHGVEEDGRGRRVRAGDGAPVFAVGHLADHREGARRFRRGEGRAHFLDVDDGLDDEAVRTGVGEGFRQAVEAARRFVEGEIAQRADELARGPHVAGHADRGRGGAGVGHGGPGDGLHFVFEAVVGEFQRGRAEGVRGDVFASRFGVFPVDAPHDIRVGEIIIVGALASGEAVFLEHGAHGAVKEMHGFLLPMRAAPLSRGTDRTRDDRGRSAPGGALRCTGKGRSRPSRICAAPAWRGP